MPATYNDLYLDARKALKGAGVEAAQLEARELLCFASGKDRTQLIHDLPLYASEGAEKRFRSLLDRRLKVVLGEWSEDALRVCRQNIRRCALTEQVQAAQADALEPPPRLLRDFDLILCNPPYIPTLEIPRLDPSVRDYEPHIALDGGEDGLKFYRAVAKKWKRALKPSRWASTRPRRWNTFWRSTVIRTFRPPWTPECTGGWWRETRKGRSHRNEAGKDYSDESRVLQGLDRAV